MLTPQEVSGRAFSKAMMGGYNMAMVDEFLDELTDDYTSLYKENAALKAKLKVLVEKVEEYRSTEDSMRATLLTAQKMAGTIVQEAEKQRDALMVEAENQIRQKIASMQNDTTIQQQRLAAGRQELAGFIQGTRALCQQQLTFLEQLPGLSVDAQTPPPVDAHPVGEIEEKILATFAPESVPETAPAIPAEEPAPFPVAQPTEESGAATEQTINLDDLKLNDLKLDDLKFGRNYSGE